MPIPEFLPEEDTVELLDKIARLEGVIEAADNWRATLDLPQQDLGCEEFNEAFEAYDAAREAIADLVPERPEIDIDAVYAARALFLSGEMGSGS